MQICMNWQAISFDWNQVRAFLATAETGSFSAAARALKLAQPTLGRQVAALEAKLGVLLFERAGRALILTRSGMDLLEHVRAMGDAAHRISLVASGQSQTVDGLVRVTTTNVMAAYLLPPAMEQLHKMAPRLEIEIVASNDIRDLQRREADIAIRHARPEQPDLIARLVAEAEAHLYASRSYLKQHGRPRSPADLDGHHIMSFGDHEITIGYLKQLGLSATKENFRLGSECGVVAWEMAKHGLAMCLMSSDVAAKTPDVERVFPDTPPVTFPIWLTAHRELATSRRIRLVYDLLDDFLSAKKPS